MLVVSNDKDEAARATAHCLQRNSHVTLVMLAPKKPSGQGPVEHGVMEAMYKLVPDWNLVERGLTLLLVDQVRWREIEAYAFLARAEWVNRDLDAGVPLAEIAWWWSSLMPSTDG
jgi:hypothetical protein